MQPPKQRANKSKSRTLKDVADSVGVSSMTVSRVLKQDARVHPETKARVMAAVQELGYRPNLSARSLAAGQSLFIALLYNNPSSAYMSEFIIGAMNACRRAGHHLVLENCGATEQDWQQSISHVLASGNFKGVLLPPPVCNYSSVLDALAIAQLPYVRASPNTHIDGVPSVGIDDQKAAMAATEHLISLGHTHIAFIKGHPNQQASLKRYEGFRLAMKAAGLSVADNDVCQGYFDYKSSLACADTLLNQTDRPTAIFASNDDMAAAVVATANKYHLNVPEHLSVLGFDDTAIATTIWPALSTIRQPIADMAAAAIDQLIDEQRNTRQISAVFDFSLVLRETTDKPWEKQPNGAMNDR